MRKLTAVMLLALCGCGTGTYVIDVYHGDRFSYRAPFNATYMEEKCAEMEGRVRLYGRDARTNYPTGVCHRIEILYYEAGCEDQTNANKRVRYWVWGEGK